MKRGYLIVAEGIDGSGKSTQCRLLAEALEAAGYSVTTLREPTNGSWGQKIRKLLTEGRGGVTPEEELQYFINDRKEDVELNIQPALDAGHVVILDRYYFSTAAYQGALGFDPAAILKENETFAPVPDMVLYFRLTPDKSLQRIQEGRDGFSAFEKKDYLEKVQSIFDSFDRPFIRRIDTDREKEVVHQEVLALARSLLEGKEVS